MMDTLKITQETSPKDILEAISSLREKKGKEKETLNLIESALRFGHTFVIQLFWEEALVYQHLVMSQDSRPEGGRNLKARSTALAKMEAAILTAKAYIEKYKIEEWESRLHRFLGRLNDYKGNFRESVKEYKKAIPLARKDPEYLEKKYPRWLELEGFLAYALVMSGKTKEGLFLARKTLEKFDRSNEGEFLKKKDYFTWAVWKSGIPIRTLRALLSKKVTFSKKEMLGWISDAERALIVPKGVRIWGDKNFQFRKDEIAATRKLLRGN